MHKRVVISENSSSFVNKRECQIVWQRSREQCDRGWHHSHPRQKFPKPSVFLGWIQLRCVQCLWIKSLKLEILQHKGSFYRCQILLKNCIHLLFFFAKLSELLFPVAWPCGTVSRSHKTILEDAVLMKWSMSCTVSKPISNLIKNSIWRQLFSAQVCTSLGYEVSLNPHVANMLFYIMNNKHNWRRIRGDVIFLRPNHQTHPRLLRSYLGCKGSSQMLERAPKGECWAIENLAPSKWEIRFPLGCLRGLSKGYLCFHSQLRVTLLTSGTQETVGAHFWHRAMKFIALCNFLFTCYTCSKDSERWENNMGLINGRKKVSDL